MLRHLVALAVSSVFAGTALAQAPQERVEAHMKGLWEYCHSQLGGTASTEGCSRPGHPIMSWHDVLGHRMEAERRAATQQPSEPTAEEMVKILWEYCQGKLNGTASKEGCKVNGEMQSWMQVGARRYVEEMVRRQGPPSPSKPPTPEEQVLRDFCEERMGGTALTQGCWKNKDFIMWPAVAERKKVQEDIDKTRGDRIEPGQWKLSFKKAVITSNDPKFNPDNMKPPPEIKVCFTAKEVSGGLLNALIRDLIKDCEYVKNITKDGAVDLELKCQSDDTNGNITAKGTVKPKQFLIDYVVDFDGAGKETGKRMRAEFVVAGEWQTAECSK